MVNSMYAKYLTEKSEDLILETDRGFATYRYVNGGKSVYIIDIYVLPDYRQSKEASSMADTIVDTALKQGCTELLGSVVPSSKGATTSLKVLLGYGMTLKSSSDNFIVFFKEIA